MLAFRMGVDSRCTTTWCATFSESSRLLLIIINLTEAGGIGYTVVDSIDTMLIMGLNDEYAHARNWVATKMFLEQNANFNTFEVHPDLPSI